MSDFFPNAISGVVVEEDIVFTLGELCRACGTERAQVLALVDEGVIDPAGSGPEDWVFDGPALRTVRTALRLAVELELGIRGAAIVLDLLAHIAALEQHRPR